MELEASLSWLAMTMTPGIAARLSARLLREFGSPEGVFRASLTALEACNLPAPAAQAIFKKQNFWRAEKEVAALRAVGAKLVNWTEPEYPQSLLQIYDPPVMLYVRGDAQILNEPTISIVGTRRPTAYGTQMAERLARELAKRGLVIVSGLARGVDALAHQGTMAVGGRAIGVIGTGIDVCYPKENKKLYEKVLERGAILSELPMGTHPAPENFPVRNRIIAGMPLGVVIVEGKQYSGSLITARLAMEFGREVFGVPGNVTQEMSFAPNQLIKQGAKLVTGWEDVVEELPTEIRAELFPVEATTQEERASLFEQNLSPIEKRLFDLIRIEEPIHVDELVETTGLSSSETLAALCEMEMRGIIRQMPGKQFVRVLL
jgi:DNA processing protein